MNQEMSGFSNGAFRIRSYSKSELAGLYVPFIATESAVAQLRKWILHSQNLHQKLIEVGYTPRTRFLTPKMVELIVDYLGAP